MLVDYESVLLDLKQRIGMKPHHGQRELALAIAELEVKYRIEEGLPERALRLYGLEFFEEAVGPPASRQDRVPDVEGNTEVRALRGSPSIQSKEDQHEHHSTRCHPSPRGDATSRSGGGARRGRAPAAATA